MINLTSYAVVQEIYASVRNKLQYTMMRLVLDLRVFIWNVSMMDCLLTFGLSMYYFAWANGQRIFVSSLNSQFWQVSINLWTWTREDSKGDKIMEMRKRVFRVMEASRKECLHVFHYGRF